ncbi:hypothetical protein BV898_08252 [Hypsibius exemplaris]|uniref:RRM domain-containing protein n=1 Tax=Hypsibius exemplaris TaxID=2072580 RepID=A0A1W0WQZ2_HYPEX|nr:hypothetical protein BV898_08252 [Hypsibius exemplaris]
MCSDIQTIQNLFSKWLQETQKVCMTAVFFKKEDVVSSLKQILLRNHESITTMLQLLSPHIASIPPPETVPEKRVEQPQKSGSRMAASLPGMNKPTPPVAIPGLSLMSPSAAAKIGSPMGVSSSPLTSNRVDNKEKHIFMEPYKTELPNDWRSEGLRKVTVENESNGKTRPISNGHSPLADENEAEDDRPGTAISNKVFLLNLFRDSTTRSIAKYFGKFGSVVDVKIFRFSTGESRGQGWIEFTNAAEAECVIRRSPHRVDGRDVEAQIFLQRDPRAKVSTASYQIFLGGVPSHLSLDEVKASLKGQVKFRDIRLISERGYAYLDMGSEADARDLLQQRYIKIGEKVVECKENNRPV